jgi:hypothetical protein
LPQRMLVAGCPGRAPRVARCHHRIKDHLGRAKRAAGWVQRVFQAADKHAENTARDPTEVGVPIARTLEARRLPFRRCGLDWAAKPYCARQGAEQSAAREHEVVPWPIQPLIAARCRPGWSCEATRRRPCSPTLTGGSSKRYCCRLTLLLMRGRYWHEPPFGSYRRFICCALTFIRPASFDPNSALGWPARYTRGIAAAT